MKINDIKFTNRFKNYLKVGKISNPKTPQSIKDYHFIECLPTNFSVKNIIAISKSNFDILNWDFKEFENKVDYLVGNKIIDQTFAHTYAGHQFRNFADQLGDGRAILLGEYKNNKDIYYDLQYKGSGLTPFSRFADGYCVLRSSIREFLASEYLKSINIPTSMCLSLVNGHKKVKRDKLYDNNISYENCAIIIRFAKSFLRFGSFQISEISHNKYNKELVENLLNFVLDNYFINIKNLENKYFHLIKNIIQLNIKLVSFWNVFGFVHGVLNTDNVNILGETIDFGPFGFMEFYDDLYTPNTSDNLSLYGYKNQINAIYFNSKKLIESVKSNINDLEYEKLIDFLENDFFKYYEKQFNKKFNERLGIDNENNLEIKNQIFNYLDKTNCDFNNFFLLITNYIKNELNKNDLFNELWKIMPNEEILVKMKSPKVNDINYLIDKNNENNIKNHFLLHYNYYPELFIKNEIKNYYILKDIKNFKENKINETDDLINNLDLFKNSNNINKELIELNNPKFVLRNCYLEDIIKDCENDNYDSFKELHQQCLKPFEILYDKYSKLPDYNKMNVCLSCSS